MNFEELNAEMGRNHLTIPKLARIVGISSKSMYERFDGKRQFKQSEISVIKQALHLTDEKVIEIFFTNRVS